jgi:hypothetical protein
MVEGVAPKWAGHLFAPIKALESASSTSRGRDQQVKGSCFGARFSCEHALLVGDVPALLSM